ncbi:MAG: RdgB/HAM1 family non-canonical purine NTP pyrophosphatase [Pseudomonadota bacterium]
MEIVLASGNRGKLEEIERLIEPLGWTASPQSAFNVPEAEETGLTFIENAILKARNACAHTGRPALADDSGLVVDALGGAPGVFSARYAGAGATDEANWRKLLAAMDGIPDGERSAQFRAVVVLMRDAQDASPIIAQGTWEGTIGREARGGGGFGYDPIVYLATHNCTVAELEAGEKDRISHRAQALRALIDSIPMPQIADRQ